MDEYVVTLTDRKQVAQDTMAFWFHVAGTGYSFRAGQNAVCSEFAKRSHVIDGCHADAKERV